MPAPASIIAIYPGSFDPITNGHLDLIARGSRLVDKLVVAILSNQAKQPLFTVEERAEMLAEVLHPYPNVEIGHFGGLLMDYAAQRGARVILRGVRSAADFEFESQIAAMNRRLRPEVETIFLAASEQYSFVSSSLVKEVASFGGDISGLLPPDIEVRLLKKLERR